MFWVVSLLMLGFGLIGNNSILIVTSGLFAIVSSIDSFTYKYFKKD